LDTASSKRLSPNVGYWVACVALGLLIHKTELPEPLNNPFPYLSTVFAVAVLWRPASRMFAFGFAASALLEIFWFYPHIYNHGVYLATATAFLLVYLAQSARAETGERQTALDSELFSAMRVAVYGVFVIAVWQKTNLGFLNPEVSCAVDHYNTLTERVGFLPEAAGTGFRRALIFGTLGGELSIPVLLFFRGTRRLGLVAALVFHFLMGINGHQAFSGFSAALYLPFLSDAFGARLASWSADMKREARTAWIPRIVPAIGTVLGVLILAAGLTERYYRTVQVGLVVFIFLIPSLFAAGLWISARLRIDELARVGGSGRWAAVVIVLLTLNGLTPYVGLKTQTSFSMYSNLRTAGDDEWNHAFFPPSMRFAHYQDTLVSVVDAPEDAGELYSVFTRRDRLVPFSFRRHVEEACHDRSAALPISIEIGGETTRVEDACTSHPLTAEDSWLEKKLLYFRPEPALNICRQ